MIKHCTQKAYAIRCQCAFAKFINNTQRPAGQSEQQLHIERPLAHPWMLSSKVSAVFEARTKLIQADQTQHVLAISFWDSGHRLVALCNMLEIWVRSPMKVLSARPVVLVLTKRV